MGNDIMVSVYMCAYNHEKYIRQAIESVLMQDTDFRYELIIGDDASPDGTQKIISEYAGKYPDIITAICRKKNIGALKNGTDIRRRCRGKYLACLEGDDFWTDKYKLQKQVDFLENNREYSLCFTGVNIIKDSFINIPYAKHDINSLDEYLNYGNGLLDIPSATIVFHNIYKRNPALEKCFTKNNLVGDRIQHTLLLKYGKFKFLNDITATYRYISYTGSSFSSIKKITRMEDTIKCFFVCMCVSGKRYYHLWYQNMAHIIYQLMEELINEEGTWPAIIYFFTKLSIIQKYYYLKRLL